MEIADIDFLLDFLRIDKDKIDLVRASIDFDERGLQMVELVYRLRKTARLNRCIIGINGLDRPDVITPRLSTSGM